MGATYTRQSIFTDGDVIDSDIFNNEFDQLLAAFASSTGHTHDGTAGEGGPITGLITDGIVFGTNTGDITLTWNGGSNDGLITWKEDEDYFEFNDDLLIATTEKIQFRDTGIYINSSADGQLDLVADTEIQIAATTIDINGNVNVSGTLTIGSAGISEAELEILDGATVTTDELNILDGVTATASEINTLDGITSTVAELNILDGVTSTAAELNILDGVTSTATELNILDGVTATAAELNILGGKAFLDEDNMASNSATGIASQQSIKAYVDSQVTAQDLDLTDGTTSIAIDLDSEALSVLGGTGVTSTASGNGVTLAIDSTVATLTGSQTLTNKSLTSPTLTGTAVVASLDISGDVDVDGTLETDALSINGTAITSTAAELNILDGKAFLDEDNLASDSATGIASQQSIKAYVDGLTTTSITATGALNSGSITSGFGNIDNGSSTITTTGAITGGSFVIGSADINENDLESIDGITAGTVAASKAVVVDANKDATGFRNITLTGELDAGSLDVSGNVDVDGTLETDALSINGTAVTSTATELNILDGVTSTTAELNILDGVTSTAAELNILDGKAFLDEDNFASDSATGIASQQSIKAYVDGITATNITSTGALNSGSITSGFGNIDTGASTITTTGLISGGSLDIDNVLINGTTIGHTDDTDLITLANGVVTVAGEVSMTTLDIGGTNVTSTASELNALDGITAVVGELNALDLGSTAIGTAIASKAVVLDANKDYTGIRNFSITGNLSVGGTTTVVDTVTMNAQNAVLFEGATADAHETTLTIVDPTADRTISLPNQSGTVPVLAAASNTAITSTPEELNILDGVTATAAELNILDGVTATTAELNILDGVTSTATELNLLDGVTSTTAELNILDGVTSTAAELNILDVDNSTLGDLSEISTVANDDVFLAIDTSGGGLKKITRSTVVSGLAATSNSLSNIVEDTTPQLGGNLDTNSHNILIDDAHFIGDESGNEQLVFQTTASAVNHLEITNNATGSNPILAAVGGDDNVGIVLTPKGTGEIVIGAGNLNYAGTAITSTGAEINILDGVTSTTAELNILDGVTSTAAELNILDGVTSTTAELNILDGVTSTAAELNILDGVTSTAAELNILDGATVVVGEINALDLGSTAVGTAIASKAVILDSNKDYTGVRNFTLSGELDAGSLDISGNADIDGTLEADAITVNGTALAEVISDTVGAMVSSNTESGITVTYQDADNTLDFTVGTLNQNTTGSAATLTTARTIGGVSFNGSANINLPGVNSAGNQNTTGSAATLTTARAIAVAGDVTGTANFDGSAGISITTTLATNAIVTANITDGNVTVAKMAANSIDSAQYVDGSIDREHLAADIIDGTKIANDAINSEHYAAGSIDAEHLASDSVTEAKMAANSVDSQAYVDGSIDQVHLADQVVNEAKMQISNAPSNGYFLSAQSGNTGGLTWAVPTDTNTTYSVGDNGLTERNFTSAFKTKLEGIASGATNTVTNATHTGEVTGSGALTIAADVVDAGNLKVTGNGTTSQFLRSDGDGTFTWATPTDTNTTYSVGNGGLTEINFTSADNTKLDGIASGANDYTHPTSAGNKHVPTGGSADQILKYSSSGTAVWADPSGGASLTFTDAGTWTSSGSFTTFSGGTNGLFFQASGYSTGGNQNANRARQTIGANGNGTWYQVNGSSMKIGGENHYIQAGNGDASYNAFGYVAPGGNLVTNLGAGNSSTVSVRYRAI